MKLKNILQALEPLAVSGPGDVEITSLAYDSRRVTAGSLFFALPGLHVDGRRFIVEAEAKGAAAVVSESEETGGGEVCHIRVKDAREAMARAACAFHGHPSRTLQVIGITGTNGKTTVAFMLRHAFQTAGIKTGLLGTVHYVIGERTIPASRTTPEAPDLQEMLAEMVRVGCAAAAMEVSSHSLAQKRVLGMRFHTAVFTNLTQDHLDFHGSLEEYFRVKSLLFRPAAGEEPPKFAAINIDDPWGEKLGTADMHGTNVITFGENCAAAVRAEKISLSRQGSAAEIVSPWGRAELRLKLLGRFNVENALAALAVCGAAGLDFPKAAASLFELEPVPGRLEQVPGPGEFQVFVDYAHTPDALQNVLSALRELTKNRLIVVFGCGGNRDMRKRPLMGAAAACLADRVIVTTDNPRKEDPAKIIEHILMGIENKHKVEVCEDRRDAIKAAIGAARPGDVILIAGKGHENYQEFYNTVVPFDDRQEAAACLEKLK